MVVVAKKYPLRSRKKSKECKKKTIVIPAVTEEAKESNDAGGREALVCCQCASIITFSSEKIEVSGAHTHSFTNPHGLFFDISCYKNAPGCAISSESSNEFTWFRGFSWQVAACRNCINHLGWLFSSDKSRFYGLISANLVPARTSEE